MRKYHIARGTATPVCMAHVQAVGGRSSTVSVGQAGVEWLVTQRCRSVSGMRTHAQTVGRAQAPVEPLTHAELVMRALLGPTATSRCHIATGTPTPVCTQVLVQALGGMTTSAIAVGLAGPGSRVTPVIQAGQENSAMSPYRSVTGIMISVNMGVHVQAQIAPSSLARVLLDGVGRLVKLVA